MKAVRTGNGCVFFLKSKQGTPPASKDKSKKYRHNHVDTHNLDKARYDS
ncbi:hypothetical protein VCHA53O466_50473 [Vibrio chagasii]|nr:hypothetical protein VCHA53O466_50473 [Vibrio chagasii]